MKKFIPLTNPPRLPGEGIKGKTKGFTLVELIIVITILAILATIAFIAFQGFTKDTRDANRIATLKNIEKGLTLNFLKTNIYPSEDSFKTITGGTLGGKITPDIAKIISFNKTPLDPKDNVGYDYVLKDNKKKFQLSTYLEVKNEILFTSNIISQTYAHSPDYKNRYLYTIGDRLGLLVDPETNELYQNKEECGEVVDETCFGEEIKLVFSNDSNDPTNTISTGGTLIDNISLGQSACSFDGNTIFQGQTVIAYKDKNVPFGQTCQQETRTCQDQKMSGSDEYKYATCNPLPGADCEATDYNGFSISLLLHNDEANFTKFIPLGTANVTARCYNNTLTYSNENFECNPGKIKDETLGTCNENQCKDLPPANTNTNSNNQEYNKNYSYNKDLNGTCTYNCASGYYWKSNTCTQANIGYIVASTGQETQTACDNNNEYQDETGKTACKTVQSGYYSTNETIDGQQVNTGESICEVNHYCSDGVKTPCPVGTNTNNITGNTNIDQCITNTYTVSGTITNGNGSRVSICGKPEMILTNNDFEFTLVNHGTDCNDMSISKEGYTCNTTTNGPASLTDNFTTVSGNCSIKTYTITTSVSGSNGTVTASTTVNHGGNITLTATPSANYIVNSWGGDCTGTATTCTLSNVTADKTVTVSFKLKTYTITTSAGTNGTVTASTTVNHGGSITLTATPSTNYIVDSWGGDCTGTATTCTLSNVTADKTVTVSFKLKTYTITTSAGTNGTVTASTTLNHGGNITLTATPSTNYIVDSWGGDCTGTATTCTLSNVTADKTVTVSFKLKTYNITTSVSGTNGTVTASTTVNHGGSITLTATPSTNYIVDSWGGDCTGTATTCTLSNVTADKTVTVSFKLKTYTITTSAGTNGTVTASTTVNHGGSITLTATPSTNYIVDSWGGACSGSATTCVLSNVTENKTVSVSFKSSCPWKECLSGGYYVAATNGPAGYNSCATDVSGYDKTKCILYIPSGTYGVTTAIYVAPTSSETTGSHRNANAAGCASLTSTCQEIKNGSGNAAAYCKNLNIGGKSWYLPPRDANGLQSIQQAIAGSKRVNVGASSRYWSSSFDYWTGGSAIWRTNIFGIGDDPYGDFSVRIHRVLCTAN